MFRNLPTISIAQLFDSSGDGTIDLTSYCTLYRSALAVGDCLTLGMLECILAEVADHPGGIDKDTRLDTDSNA